jgi:hypothetical protein
LKVGINEGFSELKVGINEGFSELKIGRFFGVRTYPKSRWREI